MFSRPTTMGLIFLNVFQRKIPNVNYFDVNIDLKNNLKKYVHARGKS